MRVDLLREVGWFEALPPLVKAQLALDIEVVELKPGDKLFSTGDPIDSVHYVIHGCFSRFDDGGKHLDEEGKRQLARDKDEVTCYHIRHIIRRWGRGVW